MPTSYRVLKVITNNIVRAYDINDHEVILLGKGIGYNKKTKDYISSYGVENTFVLSSKQETELYKQLLQSTSLKLIDISREVITYIQQHFDKPLNEHIHIALTDHIAFLVRRCKMGIPIDNPFIYETNSLYPKETEVAEKVVDMLNERLSINIPPGEIGFIVLHIVSSITNTQMSDIQRIASLINKLTEIIEKQAMVTLDKSSLNYTRLVTHLRFAIERIIRGEVMKSPSEVEKVVKEAYPQCYALALKLIDVMHTDLQKNVDKSEAVYLSLHLYRFGNEW